MTPGSLNPTRAKKVMHLPSQPSAYERRAAGRTASIAAEQDEHETTPTVAPALTAADGNFDPIPTPAPLVAGVTAVSLARIAIPADRRTFREGEVEGLAANMARVGQLAPILLTRSVGSDSQEEFRLVFGKARLEAAAYLNWPTINAVCIPEGLDPELCAIMENLGRVDLKALDRAEHVAVWVDRHRRTEHGISGNVHQKSKAGRPPGGLAQAARELPVPGQSLDARRKFIEKSMKVAPLPNSVKAAARARSLDNNWKALLELASMRDSETMLAAVDRLAVRQNKVGHRRLGEVGGGADPGTASNASCGVPNQGSGPAASPALPFADPRADGAPSTFDALLSAWNADLNLRRAWENAPQSVRQGFAIDVLGLRLA